MNRYSKIPKLIKKEDKIEGKKRNPFKAIITIQATTFTLLLSNFIILLFFLDINVTNHKVLHTLFPFTDTLMYVLYIFSVFYLSLVTSFLASALYLKIKGVDNVSNISPLMLIFASKIYKTKTGKELTGDSYKELIAKIDRAGMIEKPKSTIDYEIEEVEKEITEARAKLKKLEAKKNKKLKGE